MNINLIKFQELIDTVKTITAIKEDIYFNDKTLIGSMCFNKYQFSLVPGAGKHISLHFDLILSGINKKNIISTESWMISDDKLFVDCSRDAIADFYTTEDEYFMLCTLYDLPKYDLFKKYCKFLNHNSIINNTNIEIFNMYDNFELDEIVEFIKGMFKNE